MHWIFLSLINLDLMVRNGFPVLLPDWSNTSADPPAIPLSYCRHTVGQVDGQMSHWTTIQRRGMITSFLGWAVDTQVESYGEWMGMITSRTRSFQASWKWVPKRSPAPPWSVGSTEVRPRHTKNMDPPLIISCALDLRNPDRSLWNCFLYALAVPSLAPWMNTLPSL